MWRAPCTGDGLRHGDILPLTKAKYQPLPSQNHSREPGLQRDKAGADGQLVQKPQARRVDAQFIFLTHVHTCAHTYVHIHTHTCTHVHS